MHGVTLAAIVTVLTALAACDSTETPKRPGERIFDSQQQALERAKTVEDTIQQQADQQRREIDRASQ